MEMAQKSPKAPEKILREGSLRSMIIRIVRLRQTK